MRIRKIYFDMDGVLADFDKGVSDLAGMQPLSQNSKRPSGYDDALWSAVRKVDHFYLKLDPIPGALEMFQIIYGKYGDKCEILTGIPKEQRGIITSAEDKVEWVKKHLSDGIVTNTVYREDKKNFCGGREYILIDDFEKNIREWKEQGGTGILFTNAQETLNTFEEIEEMIFAN